MIHVKRTNIPNNLKSKNELRQLKLRPTGDPVAYTYQQHGFLYYLYDIKDTKPMKKVTENQLKALAQGRIKRLTCKRCGEVKESISDLNKNKLCWSCESILEREMHEKYKEKLSNKCKEFLLSDKYLILDTETTGLDYDSEIVEISIIDIKGEVLFHSLINPTISIPDEVVRIHGITNNMVAAAPTWDAVWDAIKGILKDKTILIFNADFDTRLIKQTCNKYNIEIQDKLKPYCIMEMYADYKESEKWIGLAKACDWEDINIVQDHRATGDCIMVLELIKKIAAYK